MWSKSCLRTVRRPLQVRDAGNLLTRAGLNIPSVDVDELTVHYRSPAELVNHLRCAFLQHARKGEDTCSRFLLHVI